jgi:hypothetical protein
MTTLQLQRFHVSLATEVSKGSEEMSRRMSSLILAFVTGIMLICSVSCRTHLVMSRAVVLFSTCDSLTELKTDIESN